MFGLYSGSDELRSIASHLRQQLLSALIDEGDVAQVHDRSRIDSVLAALLPTRAQLGNPRTSQLSAEGPPLFCFCLRVCDPEHGEFGSPLVRLQAARQLANLCAIVRNCLILLGLPGLLDDAVQLPAAAVYAESPVCCRNFDT
jgi:hypothetical protein